MNQRVYSGTTWEREVAYCRARRVGQLIFVAGTTAVNEEGEVVGGGDVGAQAEFIFKKIEKALTSCGAQLSDVVRTRMFVTDLSQFEGVARATGVRLRVLIPSLRACRSRRSWTLASSSRSR